MFEILAVFDPGYFVYFLDPSITQIRLARKILRFNIFKIPPAICIDNCFLLLGEFLLEFFDRFEAFEILFAEFVVDLNVHAEAGLSMLGGLKFKK